MILPRHTFRSLILSAAARSGLAIRSAHRTHEHRRALTMRRHGIDLVLDVGANTGQYAASLVKAGYCGRIVSFEPLPAAFAAMAGRDLPRWRGVQAAVGATPGRAEIYMSANTETSSLLVPHGLLVRAMPSAKVVKAVSVDVVAIDGIWTSVTRDARSVMLKIDVQGAEHAVLDGAQKSLSGLTLLEVEMSLVQLYDSGSSIYDLLPRLHTAGFEVVSIDEGFTDPSTGQVLDIDVLLECRATRDVAAR